MAYCEDCRKEKGLEKRFRRALAKCEYCGEDKVCHVDITVVRRK